MTLTSEMALETVTAVIQSDLPLEDWWAIQDVDDPDLTGAIACGLAAKSGDLDPTSLAAGMQLGWALCKRAGEEAA